MTDFDAIIVGAGVSGCSLARHLTSAGMRCLMLEAGPLLTRRQFPLDELASSTRMYWGGGAEFDKRTRIAFLRARLVGGGSIVNQALVDRFDSEAWDDWRRHSGVAYFSDAGMAPWYDRAEAELGIESIAAPLWNRNAQIFAAGFGANGFRCTPLRRAQRGCFAHQGDRGEVLGPPAAPVRSDCIVCLGGCPRGAKMSMLETTLPQALASGLLELVPNFEVERFFVAGAAKRHVQVVGRFSTPSGSRSQEFTAKNLILASGAIGNVGVLLRSPRPSSLKAVGERFYTHPQFMTLARYDDPVDAHKGPLQSLKSDDPAFRRQGFKLENVYAPPPAVAMLLGLPRAEHRSVMHRLRELACVEVAIRDTNPGTLTLARSGQVQIDKVLNQEDLARRDRGQDAVDRIFKATGARQTYRGSFAIGLHLMGGCAMGSDPSSSVVSEAFRVHGFDNVFCADSSVFPAAPGINPSLTVMALAAKASSAILTEVRR